MQKSEKGGTSQTQSSRGSGKGSGSGSAVSMIVDLADDSDQSTSCSAALKSTHSKGAVALGTKSKNAVSKDTKKSSKAPSSFFLSKEEQMSILAEKEESEKLAKIFERERRIQLSFQQQQIDRRAESAGGKSFIDKGSGVNPFFAMQKERVAAANAATAASSSSKSADGPGGLEGGPTLALSAETALCYFLAQNPGGHVIGVPAQDRATLALNPSTTLSYPRRVRWSGCGVYWHDSRPSAISSLDLTQDPADCRASASAIASASASVRDGSYHSSNSSCTGSGYYDNNSSSSSSSSSLSLIQLWIQYTDAVGAGLFRAPQGPLFFSKALSEGANRALHPKKAVDVVGNKHGG